KQLKSRGVLLTACSKNDEEIARQAFGHPDAVLKLDDFDFFKANWNPKHGNIVETAEELNIGLDSLVFVDDNPAEREIVRKNLPEVTVPEIGDEVSRYIEYIDRAAYFEPTELSAEDIKRSAMYSANSQRKRLESSFEDYEDYLRTLEMRAEIDRFPSVFMERITQLVNKTNQFNLTTRRYTRPELDSLRNSEDHVTLYGRLDDKFGTNGLVTVIIGEVLGQSLSITLWVMSCRVFGRNMEFAMFDALRHECRERDLTEILGHYYPTKRNGLVADLYGRLGFELVEQKDSGDSSWRYRIPDDYHPMNYVIECS
ncbi:MAG TPA: HAD-IIIC family phosphatase, partial [Candidatus Krumholzibacterium sp.]|nr:HAD-IIIC family phosphatase [Candidatus Krumholzibacterium sp.]